MCAQKASGTCSPWISGASADRSLRPGEPAPSELASLTAAAEAAETVLWLFSDGASYGTGHSMIVDGGWTAAVR